MNRIKVYHRYYSQTGLYPFLIKNTLKLLIALGILGVAIYLFDNYIMPFSELFEKMFVNFSDAGILTVFTISESVLGLLPPDLFILWAAKFDNPLPYVWLLGGLSYIGGNLAYLWGSRIVLIPKVSIWIHNRFKENAGFVKKWGGPVIVLAALTPLPYSPICLLAGMFRFPFRTFLVLGVFRIIRFVLYALVIHNLAS